MTFRRWAKCSREAASEGQTVMHIRFCSLSNISKWQIGATAQTWQQYSINGCMVDLQRYRATSEERNFTEPFFRKTIQRSNFLGGNFNNRDNVRAPIQFRRESQSQHLKNWFFLKNRPITSLTPVLLDWSNETSRVFHYWNQQATSCPSPQCFVD